MEQTTSCTTMTENQSYWWFDHREPCHIPDTVIIDHTKLTREIKNCHLWGQRDQSRQPKYTHAHTHTHIHSPAHTHEHIHTLSLTLVLSLSLSHTHSPTHVHTYRWCRVTFEDGETTVINLDQTIAVIVVVLQISWEQILCQNGLFDLFVQIRWLGKAWMCVCDLELKSAVFLAET